MTYHPHVSTFWPPHLQWSSSPSPLHLNCLHTITRTVCVFINSWSQTSKGPSPRLTIELLCRDEFVLPLSLMTIVNLLQFPQTPALTASPCLHSHSQMAPPSTPQRSLETNTSNPNSTCNPSPLKGQTLHLYLGSRPVFLLRNTPLMTMCPFQV